MSMRPNDVQDLALTYFELLGAEIEPIAPGAFRIELAPDRASLFEPNRGYWMWAGPGAMEPPSRMTYYFTFDPDVAQQYEDFELIGPGAARWHQIIESIRNIGQASRFWAPAPAWASVGSYRYRPFYCLLLRLHFRAKTAAPARLFSVAIDRIDGIPLRQVAAMLPSVRGEPGHPPADAEVEQPQITFADSFAIAVDEVVESLRADDPAWAASVNAAIEAERERLLAFYEQKAGEGEAIEAERDRRMSELETLKPWVHLRLQMAAEAFLPVGNDGRLLELSRRLTPKHQVPGSP